MTLLVTLTALVACMLLARRSMVVTYSFFLLFMLVQWFRCTKSATLIKWLPLYAVVVCAFLFNSEAITVKLTEKFRERLNEDTRSYVFENFFKSMENDMIFGKGMNGKYYSPIDETFAADGMRYDDIEFRDIIENGYLQTLLTGGIVNVTLLLLIMLPAALLGIFKSKNDFTRACGLTILLYLIDMISFGLPRLTTHYLLVWISAGICYKKSIRELTNETWIDHFAKYRLR
jgi:O-antigen ligase